MKIWQRLKVHTAFFLSIAIICFRGFFYANSTENSTNSPTEFWLMAELPFYVMFLEEPAQLSSVIQTTTNCRGNWWLTALSVSLPSPRHLLYVELWRNFPPNDSFPRSTRKRRVQLSVLLFHPMESRPDPRPVAGIFVREISPVQSVPHPVSHRRRHNLWRWKCNSN